MSELQLLKTEKDYAEEINSIIQSIKKDYGIFFTPDWVVDLMVSLLNESDLKTDQEITILEPACGIAQFLTGIQRNKPDLFNKANKFGVEINKDIVGHLKAKDITKDITIINEDFLLWKTELQFNIIIGNPPYGIPSLSEHYHIKVDGDTKNKYKESFLTWYGKYNVYGAFIEKSIQLLKENGQLAFIVPATFIFLDEFKKLRKFLANNGNTHIIYMGQDVFKPGADVATVILLFNKSLKQSRSLTLSEYKNGELIKIKFNQEWRGDIITFKSDFTEYLENACKNRLGDIYEINISPRTPEIKKNPYIIKSKAIDNENYIPILNGRNLKINEIIYEPLTEHWIDKNKINTLRNFFDKPHIVVGHGFRGDRQIAAAYDFKTYPWMGDVYHLFRKHTFITHAMELTDEQVVDYLNSDSVKNYVMDTFREVTYHLSITQLKQIPIPTTNEELKKITRENYEQKLGYGFVIFREGYLKDIYQKALVKASRTSKGNKIPYNEILDW